LIRLLSALSSPIRADMEKAVRQIAFITILIGSHCAYSQTPVMMADNFSLPIITTVAPEPAVINPIQPRVPPCARPADFMDIDTYSGPFNHLVERFSAKLENTTVHPVRRHHAPSCSLDARDKFNLFASNVTEPIGFLGAGWDAALAQRENDDRAFGQGAAGYGKRYSAAITSQFTGEFFGTFFYPAIFRQDPRYYRLAEGTPGQRLLHAARHIFVAHNDSGRLMFNFSEWMGTASSVALNNFYHPGNERGFGPAAQRAGLSITSDMAMNVVKEFWPEITHKCRLPFRSPSPASSSVH
ncbi:MAG TPA: hypothetical protein VEW69_06045, partial [Alphaproteobacteria bacterium]|nr:hypothetical protein [Alphaproteobacteria bacterium]